MVHHHHARALFAATLAALLLAASCTLTLDFNECSADADCAGLAQNGERLVCDLESSYCVQADGECDDDNDCTAKAPRTSCQDNACVEPANNQTNNNTNNTNNSTNNNNNNTNNNSAECSNQACIASEGANHICDKTLNRCISLLSAECNTVEGPVQNENIIIIGSILPTVGENEAKGVPRENAIRLAVKEINDGGGLPNGYRIVLVGCNDGGTSALATSAANHLVNTLHVPAIIGPAFSTPYIDVVTTVTASAGVLTISPSATSTLITDLDDDDLAWRTVPSDAFQSVAIADRIRDRQTGLGRAIRVLAFAKDDAYGNGILNALSEQISGELGANYAAYVYDPTSAADITTKVTQGTTAIADPDLIVVLGTTEGVSVVSDAEELLEALEPKPTYLLSDGGQVQDLLDYARTHDGVAERIEGTIPNLENGAIYTTYRGRYRARFGTEPTAFTGNAYDATYLIAYDLVALLSTDSPITGPTLARNIERLVDTADGRVVEIGPSGFNQGKNTLSSGSNINLEGVSGILQFNLVTGDTSGNYILWGVNDGGAMPVFSTLGDYILDENGEGAWTLR